MNKELVKELASLVLWSARRLKDIQAIYALNDFLNLLKDYTDEDLNIYREQAELMLREIKEINKI